MRGRQPGASARLCPAGAPLWRAADTLPAPGSAAADFSWRARKAERGCERQRVCVARAGAGASPDPTPSSAPPRVSALRGPSPCGPRSEAEGLSPRALLTAFVAGARKPERGVQGAAARGSAEAEAAAAGGAAPTGLSGAKGLRASGGEWAQVRRRGGDSDGMERAQLGKVESFQRWLGVCSVSLGFFPPHQMSLLRGRTRVSSAVISIFR